MIKIFTINFLLAISAAMGMVLLPILATESLGVSLLVLGMIEGSAELVSNILKLVSGNLFDRLKNKKYLFITPILFSLLSKVALLVFISKYSMLFSKLSERMSNGLFASPRDAYIAKNASNKGFAISMLSCSKTAGCILGTLIISMSTLFLGTIQNNIVYLAVLAACITSIALIISFFIKADITVKEEVFSINGFGKTFKKLTPIYILAFIFFLARFNDGLLMLFLKSKGLPEWFYLSTISFFNFVMFFISPLFGIMLKDKELQDGKTNTRLIVLYSTIVSLFLFNVSFLCFDYLPWFLACSGLIFWGIQRAGAAIVFSYFIAKNAKKKFIGTAIGIMALINAVGTFISSICAGYLTNYGFESVFMFTGILSFCTILLAVNYVKTKKLEV